jgi:hypothetical protein
LTKPINIILWIAVTSTAAFGRSSIFDRAEYRRPFDKTVTVQAGERVSIEHRFGDIVIRTHPTQDVIIHADIHVSASDSNEATDYAGRVEILVEHSSELLIRTRYPETPRSIFGTHNISFSVHYEVTIPESSPLHVRNAFGAVIADGVKAGSDILTSHGELQFHNGRGTQHLEDSFARVEVGHNAGDVTIHTTNGEVTANDISGSLDIQDRFGKVTVAKVSNRLKIATGNGAVEANDCGGDTEIKTSFGSVTVSNLRGALVVNDNNGKIEATGIGGSLWLVTSFGPVEVRDVQRDVHIDDHNGEVSVEKAGGPAEVKTSFGAVHVNNIAGLLTVTNANGAVKASNVKGAQVTTSFGAVMLDGVAGPIQVQDQNGSVEVSTTVRDTCVPVNIRTSFGPIKIRLEPNPSYKVAAKTSFGKIRSDFPLSIQGALSGDEINGSIGAARCEMNLTNQNGSIEIVRQ